MTGEAPERAQRFETLLHHHERLVEVARGEAEESSWGCACIRVGEKLSEDLSKGVIER